MSGIPTCTTLNTRAVGGVVAPQPTKDAARVIRKATTVAFSQGEKAANLLANVSQKCRVKMGWGENRLPWLYQKLQCSVCST